MSINISAQGEACEDATEFCPFGNQDAVTFPAGVNNPNLASGNNYGCLISTPNPIWYYIEIGAGGSIEIQLSNSNIVDIDFALWGPFDNLNTALSSCGALDQPADCSYSAMANEMVTIGEAQVGQTYILLITNFSNVETDISGVATGTGEIACCTLALDEGESCSASSEFGAYCWNTGLDLKLANSGGAMPVDFCGTSENYRWASFEATHSISAIEISTQNCEQALGVHAQLFSSCADLVPHSECLEINDNTVAFLTDAAGNPNLDFNLGETYSLLLASSASDTCTYRVTTLDPNAPVFQQDTLAGSFSVCPNDTVTYAFPTATNTDSYEVEISSIDAEIAEITTDSFTVFYGELAGNLCVHAINETDTVSLCQEVTILAASDCETSVAISSAADLTDYSLQVIPNPVRHSFRFKTKDIGAKWEIINTAGQVLQSGNVSAESTLVLAQKLPFGTYFLRVKGEQVQVGKFIVN